MGVFTKEGEPTSEALVILVDPLVMKDSLPRAKIFRIMSGNKGIKWSLRESPFGTPRRAGRLV